MKEFIGSCVSNPFTDMEKLTDTIDNAEDITLREFIKECDVNLETLRSMIIFPTSYTYHKNGDIYFYVNSAIEHFFQ